MELIKVEMEIPKESKEVVDSIDGLLGHFMDKKPIAEITLQLPALMSAFEGYEGIKEEMGSDKRDELAAYLVQKLMARLAPVKKEEPAV